MSMEDAGLRIRALELAQAHWSSSSPSTADIVTTASKFYKFIVGDQS